MSLSDYPLAADTSEETEIRFFALLAKKSHEEKMHMVGEMNRTVKSVALCRLRDKYPRETDKQLHIKLAELWYGEDVARKVAEYFARKQA